MCTERPKLKVSIASKVNEDGCFTSSCVQSSTASVAFEMLRFLVGYEDLQVVEVALAVEAPWPLELLVEIGISLAFLRHPCFREIGEGGSVV